MVFGIVFSVLSSVVLEPLYPKLCGLAVAKLFFIKDVGAADDPWKQEYEWYTSMVTKTS